MGSSLSLSDNFRNTTFSSNLCKLIDVIVMTKKNDNSFTSNFAI